jgi:hypothetical protein
MRCCKPRANPGKPLEVERFSLWVRRGNKLICKGTFPNRDTAKSALAQAKQPGRYVIIKGHAGCPCPECTVAERTVEPAKI